MGLEGVGLGGGWMNGGQGGGGGQRGAGGGMGVKGEWGVGLGVRWSCDGTS